MTFTRALSTNNYGSAKFIVDGTTVANGTHSTISTALTSASAGDTILVRPGSYTENLTLKAGVNICAYVCDAYTPNVTIIGKLSCSYSGTASISGIRLTTNSDNIISLTGANATILNVVQCYLNCSNNTGISSTGSNASSLISVINSKGDIGTTGIALFSVSNGGIDFNGCEFSNTGASTTASTVSSAAVLSSEYTRFFSPITTSNTSVLGLTSSTINTLAQNVTSLTVNGTGGSSAYFVRLAAGTASAVSIGAGANLISNALQLSSSNAALTAGAGTLTYNVILSDTTNGTLSTTTLTPKGIVGMQKNTAPSPGFIGERIESVIGVAGATTLTTGTGTNFTSISLTPGIWDVNLLTMFNGTVTGTLFQSGISVNSNATGLTLGDNSTESTTPPTAASDVGYVLPSYRISLAATTTYYANVVAVFSVGTLKAYGRISATRVA